MTQNWPEHLRTRLEAQKVELAARVGKIKQDIARGLEADSAEQASQLENQEVLDALANAGVTELAQVNAALQRMNKLTRALPVAAEEFPQQPEFFFASTVLPPGQTDGSVALVAHRL